jgi:NAD(P)-dependent dehydrogenase (short-subunit alcohol dehydrogenase family)
MGAQSPLLNRTAVVTGAARGIGAEVARALVRRGARVALLGLEERELRRLADSLGGPSAAGAWPVDVTDEAALGDAAELVRTRLGRPSVVVANAGIAAGGPLLHSDPALWRRIVEVNLVGSAMTARAFLPDLLDARGYYLQVTSLAALGAAPLMSAYCASKSGAESFAHALRAEVAARGVDVGVGYVGWTDTDMIQAAQEDATMRAVREAMPWPAARLHSATKVAERLVGGVERRSPAVFTPPWQRLVRVARGVLPGIVVRATPWRVGGRGDVLDFEATGPLGAGGAADESRRYRSAEGL